MPIRKETGKERQFNTGAKKQAAAGKGTPVLVPGDAILDLAKHFEEGAVVHGDRNWEKGIPLSELLNSAERHLQQLKMGLTDESHDRAFVWNAIVYLATKLRIAAGILPVELDDMPKYKDQRIFEITLPQYLDLCDEFEIEKDSLGWYIHQKNSVDSYLYKDLIVRKWTPGEKRELVVYYKAEKLAKETLQAYLDKENRHGYCTECYERIKNAKDGEAVLICEKCKNIIPDDTYKA